MKINLKLLFTWSKFKPPFPAEFRQKVRALTRSGRTPAQLAREFGPSAQTITNRVAQHGHHRGQATARSCRLEANCGSRDTDTAER